MTHIEYEVLVRLDGAGDSLRFGELARQCVSSKSRLTYTMKGLATRGWIETIDDPSDRRATLARLTPDGAQALEAAAEKHALLVKQHLLDHLQELDLGVLGDTFDVVSQQLRALRES